MAGVSEPETDSENGLAPVRSAMTRATGHSRDESDPADGWDAGVARVTGQPRYAVVSRPSAAR